MNTKIFIFLFWELSLSFAYLRKYGMEKDSQIHSPRDRSIVCSRDKSPLSLSWENGKIIKNRYDTSEINSALLEMDLNWLVLERISWIFPVCKTVASVFYWQYLSERSLRCAAFFEWKRFIKDARFEPRKWPFQNSHFRVFRNRKVSTLATFREIFRHYLKLTKYCLYGWLATSPANWQFSRKLSLKKHLSSAKLPIKCRLKITYIKKTLRLKKGWKKNANNLGYWKQPATPQL